MTANEMRNLFAELYDGASAQKMGYDDVEVSRFLNLAQILIFQEKYFGNRNQLREGFEIGSKRDIELNNLKRSITLWKNTTDNKWYIQNQNQSILQETELIVDKIMDDNSIMFEIPNEILFIHRDTADILYNGNLYRNIDVKNINEDDINSILKDPFKQPDISVIYRTILKYDIVTEDEDDDFHIITFSNKIIKLFIPLQSSLNRWNCSYIKRPIQIRVNILNPYNQIDCELDEIIHNDICFKAVELAMGSIGSQKIQNAIYNTNKNIT